MQIVCISSGKSSKTQMLAERLANKLGYKSHSREEVVEEAIKEGIQVSKLETAIIKPQIFTERLALEREYYRAFTTFYLCKQAMEGGMVYYGRSGHLLFPGIAHVLKVCVVEDEGSKINDVVRQLRMDRTKARRYLEEVEADRKRWARSMYGVSWEDAIYYDIVLNLSHMSPENGAAALATIAQLPDFQMTPSSIRAVEDLMLGANARVLLARDERTFRANVKVRADRGVVTVTYLPQDVGLAEVIPEVLGPLEAGREIQATMATTNILWIQEAYDPASETFHQVVEIATKWNAAVELLQSIPENGEPEEDLPTVQKEAQGIVPLRSSFNREYIGGIEEEQETVCDDKGLRVTHEELARLGRSGGGRVVYGDGEQIVKSIDRTVPYSLVVIGNILLSKGHSAQLRMARHLQGYLSDYIKAPIVNAEELKTQYLFSKHDLLRMLGYLGLVVLILILVLTNQKGVLKFLSGVEWRSKVLAAAAVFLFIPVFAYLYGNVTKALMKLIRME